MVKVLKRLILNRMSPAISAALSPSQFGFRTGRGSTDAIQAVLDIVAGAARRVTQDRHLCVLVTLDVKNAFNTVL